MTKRGPLRAVPNPLRSDGMATTPRRRFAPKNNELSGAMTFVRVAELFGPRVEFGAEVHRRHGLGPSFALARSARIFWKVSRFQLFFSSRPRAVSIGRQGRAFRFR